MLVTSAQRQVRCCKTAENGEANGPVLQPCQKPVLQHSKPKQATTLGQCCKKKSSKPPERVGGWDGQQAAISLKGHAATCTKKKSSKPPARVGGWNEQQAAISLDGHAATFTKKSSMPPGRVGGWNEKQVASHLKGRRLDKVRQAA